MILRSRLGLPFLVALTLSCGDDTEPDEPSAWQVVQERLPGALLSVWGTAATDVWAVGADAGDGRGATVLHLEGGSWARLDTGQTGDLWWVHGFAGGPLFMGGAGGVILRYDAGAFTRMETPGTGVVFGLWGSSPEEMWAVGGEAGGSQGAFAWRLDGERWAPVPGFPSDLAMTDALWKVYGRGADDVWMVGTGGKMLHWDGSSLTPVFAGLAESLFTVHGSSQRFVTVGGFGSGLLLEHGVGTGALEAWTNMTPAGALSIIGVCATEQGGHAVGQFGYVAERRPSGWVSEETGLEAVVGARSLHSVWIDPGGGVWAAGGQVLVPPLVDGILLHRGDAVPTGDGSF